MTINVDLKTNSMTKQLEVNYHPGEIVDLKQRNM